MASARIEFLALNDLHGQTIMPLPSDASSRRYYRLPERNLLLMEDPHDPVGFDAFARLSGHLNALGLSAPKVVAIDARFGLALIEDFGDGTYSKYLQQGLEETSLYKLAVDALLHLHANPNGAKVAQQSYDLQTYLDEIDIFSQWFAPAVSSDLDRVSFAKEFRALWDVALRPIADRVDTLVLRDFHVDNLMWLPARNGVACCGLLDFQDGVLGPCEYDLVSLLQDARRDLAPNMEQTLLSHYIKHAPERLGTAHHIRERYHILAAQRHTRIAGVFVRLSQRDNKPRYLEYLPRVLRQIENAITDAGLTEIADFMRRKLPNWQEKGAALQCA